MSRSQDQRPPAPPLPQQWRHPTDNHGAGAPPPQAYGQGWPPQAPPHQAQHPHQPQHPQHGQGAPGYAPPVGYSQQQPAQPPPFMPQPPAVPHHQVAPQQQAVPSQPRTAPPYAQQQDPRSQPAQWPPLVQPVSHQQPPAYPPPPSRDPAGFDTFAQTVGRAAPPPPPPFPPGVPDRVRAERMRPDQLRPDQLRPDQLRQEQPRPQPARHPHEADGYDLSSYAVPPPTADPRYAAPQQAQWRDAGAYPPAGHAQAQAYDADLGRRGPHSQGPAGQPPAHYGAANDEVEYEEPRRSRRWLIVGALVGSIVVGGGMAYGYKLLVSDKGSGGKPQVVRAPKEPAKTAPDDRGGKRFANTDNKFMNRVPSDGGGAGEQDGSGVRRVQTVTVGKDMGSPPPVTGAVPGMTIVGADGMPNSGLPPLPPSMAPSPVQSPVRSAAPPQPSAGGAPRVAAAPPPPAPPRPPVARPAPIDPPIESTPPPPRQPVARAAPPPPSGAGAGTEPPPAGAAAAKVRPTTGYVAVLGFQRTQVEAMRMMADLQQKYDVLRDKRLDIVSSDQSARGLGVIYRVVVGPPGRIDAAKGTCAELAKAGHPAGSCYPLAN